MVDAADFTALLNMVSDIAISYADSFRGFVCTAVP
jgi:hypothetical protein